MILGIHAIQLEDLKSSGNQDDSHHQKSHQSDQDTDPGSLARLGQEIEGVRQHQQQDERYPQQSGLVALEKAVLL